MLYLKHSELVEKYHVSLKTVHNWIDAAKQNKVDLDLYEKNGRTFVANNSKNIIEIERLVEQGKKYRNTKYYKTITPKPEFYKLYSQGQILDIISNLDVHKEIPRDYNYFEKGAHTWDVFATMQYKEDGANALKSTIELLEANTQIIDKLIGDKKQVNVIDLGPGNGLPIKDFLARLVEKNVLHRYIAIDISQEMINIAESNIRSWFGDKVKFEGYVRDITTDRFDDLLLEDMLDQNAPKTINLVLLFGGTLTNFLYPYDCLKTVYQSMSLDDLLFYEDKPDTAQNRRYFGVNATPNKYGLSPKYSFITELMNIDGSLYDVEMGFNEEKRVRYIQLRLKTALTIKFKFENGERSVSLEKGEAILLLRVWHQNTLEIFEGFEQVGFKLLQSSLTKDRQFLLTISGIDSTPELA